MTAVTPPAARSWWAPPTAAEARDASFLVTLALIGLAGFGAAYGGRAYLLVGLVGLLAGVAIAHVTQRAGLPVVLLVVVSVLTALLLAGLPLRDTAVARFLPSVDTVRTFAHVVLFGWKQLLTTVRPVGDAEHLLALPYLLGLAAGVAGHSLARRTASAALPIAPPAVLVALSILFGSAHPWSATLQGAAFACAALAWAALRRARRTTGVIRNHRVVFRATGAGVLLAASFGGASVVGPAMPFATSRPRVVLHVEPPFDLSVYQSPLAAFRRYTKAVPAQQSLADRTLFTVTGAEPGQVVRIAALDDYDGKVWGVTNHTAPDAGASGFARIGSALPPTGSGGDRAVRIVIGDGYRDVWLPSVGSVQRLSFSGDRAKRVRRSVRYNLATRTGVVGAGLRSGDVVTLTAKPAEAVTDDQLKTAEPDGTPLVPAASYQFVNAAAAKFAGDETAPLARVLRIAATMRVYGTYSHGRDAVQSDPGHGTGRIATFLQSRVLVGDDEQYGAAMALMANAVGVPARVVLTATPRADGTVKGSDVQVGVELAIAGRGWVPLATDRFTPPHDRRPQRQPKEALPKVPPKVVPPPVRPPVPGNLSATDAASSAARRAPRKHGFAVPRIVVAVATWTGPPFALLASFAGTILLLKGARRRRRRSRGPHTTRVAMGWAEVLDTVRDVGAVVLPGTRREQARALSPLPVAGLAFGADAVVFGPGEASDDDVAQYWSDVAALRRTLTRDMSRLRRLRVALSLRSLVPALGRAPITPAGATP